MAKGVFRLSAADLKRKQPGHYGDGLGLWLQVSRGKHGINRSWVFRYTVADRTPLLWGLDQAATAVAWHAAFVLASHAGVVSDVAGYQQAIGRAALHRAAVQSSSGSDLFADPDDEQPTQPPDSTHWAAGWARQVSPFGESEGDTK